MKKHSRTKACEISPDVKRIVYKRDGRCLMCGSGVREENACCHLIPRSQGGMGVEKNILTLCQKCHREFDEGPDREYWTNWFNWYLTGIYGPIERSEVVYDKWEAIFGNQQ